MVAVRRLRKRANLLAAQPAGLIVWSREPAAAPIADLDDPRGIMAHRNLLAFTLVMVATLAGCTPAATPTPDATAPPQETSTMAAAASLIP